MRPKPPPESPPHPPLPEFYREAEERPGFVRSLFDETAPHYDWIIGAMALGTGNSYRARALRKADLAPGMRLLDVAIGTGPVAREAVKIVGDAGLVIGVDVSLGMLEQMRRKVGVPAVQALGEDLPFAEATFDFLSMGYALRHVTDLEVTMREYLRVLKTGGRVLILELTRPANPVALRLLGIYLGRIVPAMAWLGSGSRRPRELMRYFWETITHCLPPDAILDAMRRAGFDQVERRTELGIFSEYTGTRPR